jgi:hypothetical protein
MANSTTNIENNNKIYGDLITRILRNNTQGGNKISESKENNIVFSPNFVINTTGKVDEKHLATVIEDRIFTSLRKGKGKEIVKRIQ